MNHPGRRVCLGILVSILGLTPGGAVPAAEPQVKESNWDNLKRLSPGDKVQVVLKGVKSYRGLLESVSDEGIVVRLATGDQTFARLDILRVSTKGESHRARNAMIGFGAGAALGLLIGGSKNCGDAGCGAEGFLIGAAIGPGVGASLPTGRWHTVYRAP
jgi:hypothetical protein